MIYIVTAVGILICAGALAGLVSPSTVTGAASRVLSSRPLKSALIAVRIIFGAVAIIVSDQTPYPLAMKVIGVISIMAGTITAFLDKDKLNQWIETANNGGAGMRALFLAALGLGAFLIHASL